MFSVSCVCFDLIYLPLPRGSRLRSSPTRMGEKMRFSSFIGFVASKFKPTNFKHIPLSPISWGARFLDEDFIYSYFVLHVYLGHTIETMPILRTCNDTDILHCRVSINRADRII